jgi:hypothetical protein
MDKRSSLVMEVALALLIVVGAYGCANQDDGAELKDADATGDGDGGDSGVDAAAPPRCESFAERDGGAVVAGADGGIGGDAGATGDAGETAWYESGNCLSRADDCTVHEGWVGDHVCVELGHWAVGAISSPWYFPAVDGDCAGLLETVAVPVFPSEQCVVVDCTDRECAIIPFYCSYYLYSLFELTAAGECVVEVRTEPSWPSRDFDILFRVLEP